ncbi:MAG: SDR family NAD(P)-dependent oxidoreductase [Acidimicrobiaceae bacterium]|nr:SDR family NAD(P)-dependent oxidoreductase [Acidimicrobiaceae bacterium]
MTSSGRRALITGAGSGIGAACVDRLLAQGCRVTAVDLHAGDMAARAG